jgi:hypothetical protein
MMALYSSYSTCLFTIKVSRDPILTLVVIILDSRVLIHDSIIFIVLVVTEAIRISSDRTLNLVPVAVHGLVIDVEVIHVAGLNRFLPLQHGVVWVLLLALVHLYLALAEFGPRPLLQLTIEVCLGLLLRLEVQLLSLLHHLFKGLIVDLLKNPVDIRLVRIDVIACSCSLTLGSISLRHGCGLGFFALSESLLGGILVLLILIFVCVELLVSLHELLEPADAIAAIIA